MTTATVTPTRDHAADLLAVLVMDKGLFEVKAIHPTMPAPQNVKVDFYDSPAALLRDWQRLEALNGQGWGVYFGVATFTERKGTKDKAAWLWTVHADLDGKDFADDWRTGKLLALDMLANLPAQLAPAALVDSGHGIHAYWPLQEPLPATSENIKAVEGANGALAAFLGSDPAVKDVSRVMRLPGLVNTKDAERLPVVVFGGIDGRRFDVADFQAIMPAKAAQPLITPASESTGRTGDDFNARGNWSELLTKHGWKEEGRRGETSFWCRPGKDAGISARLNKGGDGLLYVYSSNAGALAGGQSYSLFGAFAALEHSRDFRAATKSLAALGYGTTLSSNGNGQHTGAVMDAPATPPVVSQNGNGYHTTWHPPERKTIWSTPELLGTDFPEPRWAVPGLVPVGLSFLAGRPKLGKSWLAMQMAIAVGTGGKVFDLDIERGNVLYLALEDSERRLQERTQKQGITHNAAITWATEWATMPVGGADHLLQAIETGGYRFVVIDTLSRFVGSSDQQNLAAMTMMLGSLQRLALGLEVAVLMVDHHRKAGALGADVIDDVLGSTGKAAVADAVLGLYKQQGRKGAQLAVTGRDLEEKTLALEFDPLTWCWQSLGDADDVRRDSVKSEIVTAIERLSDLGELATATSIAEFLGKKKPNVYFELVDLVNNGLVLKAPKQGRLQPYHLPGQQLEDEQAPEEDDDEASQAGLWG